MTRRPPIIPSRRTLGGLLIFLLAYASAFGFKALLLHLAGPNATPNDLPILKVDLAHIVVIITLAIGGLARVWFNHPVGNRNYASWLIASPWTPTQPLPLGSLVITLYDLLAVAFILSLDIFHLHESPVIPLIVYVTSYLVSAVAAQLVTRFHPSGWVILFSLPAMFLVYRYPLWIPAGVVALYPVAAIGIHSSLKHFPWHMFDPPAQAPGWPFEHIGPVGPKQKYTGLQKTLFILLLSWVVFCVATCVASAEPFDPDFYKAFPILSLSIAAFVALFRWLAYAASYRPPLSLLGRFATGHLLIPGYDKIFIAPWAIIFGGAIPPLALHFGLPPQLACALVPLAILLPAFLIGPSLDKWKLTGQYQITSPPPRLTARRNTQSNELKIRLS